MCRDKLDLRFTPRLWYWYHLVILNVLGSQSAHIKHVATAVGSLWDVHRDCTSSSSFNLWRYCNNANVWVCTSSSHPPIYFCNWQCQTESCVQIVCLRNLLMHNLYVKTPNCLSSRPADNLCCVWILDQWRAGWAVNLNNSQLSKPSNIAAQWGGTQVHRNPKSLPR